MSPLCKRLRKATVLRESIRGWRNGENVEFEDRVQTEDDVVDVFNIPVVEDSAVVDVFHEESAIVDVPGGESAGVYVLMKRVLLLISLMERELLLMSLM
ncbi:hypothetical protein PoB_000935200 [Plakobranchus ocellatus]|uniref:Uncharacterized protein n=1 Tax=Plakobranchus ocellatus TaxID=259542 RepID=A0AAV3YIY7_9GAST|nr:hypothetical protein PoB_000935200 [Plakobranchus ocellatus]